MVNRAALGSHPRHARVKLDADRRGNRGCGGAGAAEDPREVGHDFDKRRLDQPVRSTSLARLGPPQHGGQRQLQDGYKQDVAAKE